MAKNGLIALRPLRGRGAGLVRLSGGEAVFALRGVSRGRAHLVLEGGRVLSALLSRTPGGAQTRIRYGGSVMGAGVTAGPEVLLAGLSGPGSLAELTKRLHMAAQGQERAAREEGRLPSEFAPAGETESSEREASQLEKEPETAQTAAEMEQRESGEQTARQSGQEEFPQTLKAAVAQRPEAEDVLRMMPHPVPAEEEEQKETEEESAFEKALSETEEPPEEMAEDEMPEKGSPKEPQEHAGAEQEQPEERIRIWEGLPREERKETVLTEEAALPYIPPQEEERLSSGEAEIQEELSIATAQGEETGTPEQTETFTMELSEEMLEAEKPETRNEAEAGEKKETVLMPEEKEASEAEEAEEHYSPPEWEKKEGAPAADAPASERAEEEESEKAWKDDEKETLGQPVKQGRQELEEEMEERQNMTSDPEQEEPGEMPPETFEEPETGEESGEEAPGDQKAVHEESRWKEGTEEGGQPEPLWEEPAEEVCPCEVDRMERAGSLAAMVAPATEDAEAEAMLPHRSRGERRLFFPQNDWERQCLDVLMERQPCWKPARGKLMGVFVNAFPREYPRANWQIFSQVGGSHVLRCQWQGRVYYALPAQQSAQPPAGLPAGSVNCAARNQRRYWVFCKEETGR